MSPKESEVNRERFPNYEEVKSQILEFAGGREYVEARKKEDEDGIYLLEIVVKNDKGEDVEYSYQRKLSYGTHKEGSAIYSAIHVTFYDKDGFPGGGHTLGEYKDGVWVPTDLPSDSPCGIIVVK